MKDDTDICDICGNGHLLPHIDTNPAEYKGVKTQLEMLYSVCDGCGSEQADGDQLKANKRAMIRFRKIVDGLLTGEEVRSIRTDLRLSQADAAKIFGGGPVAFSKYENDEVAQSEAMDKMIRLAAALPAAYDYLAKQAGIERVIASYGWSVMEGVMSAMKQSHRPKLKVVFNTVNEEQPRYAA